MDLSFQRAMIARSVNAAANELLEASERASDLKRFDLSSQLLDQSLYALEVAKELLDVSTKPAASKYCLRRLS